MSPTATIDKSALRALLRANAPLKDLRHLLASWVADGASRDQLRQALNDARSEFAASPDIDDSILEALDIVEDWCSPDLRLPFSDDNGTDSKPGPLAGEVSDVVKAAHHDQQYAYWVAYYDEIQHLIAPYSEIIDQFPSFIASPVKIRVREARDGFVVIHTTSDSWSFGSASVDADLRDIAGFVQVPTAPASADLDLWVGQTSLTISDAITGEIVGEKASDWDRLDVVASKRDARWDPIHARIAAQRDFASVQARIAVEALGATKVVEALRTQIEAFRRELDANPVEGVMQRFLEEHPHLLAPSAAKVVPQVQLGSDYVTDFVIVESDSEYVLVELESPRQLLFTRKGRPRAELTHAIQQTRDWRAWVRQHREYAQSRLPGITEPRCIVVIGRRPTLSDEEVSRLQNLNAEEMRIRVMTYDDLIAQASQFVDNLEAVAKPYGQLVTPPAPDNPT